MMIRYKSLSREEAKKIIAEYDNYDDIAFRDLVKHWEKYDPVSEYDESYIEFRKELIKVFCDTLDETGGKINYLLDLRVGLKLYSLLSPGKDFSVIQANNDDIWRYISVKVMPDITYLRYPKPEKKVREEGGRINHKRFYTDTRRIWLKSLWWYIHLSWQGTAAKTYKVLEHNGIDDINKLIETPGRGYRLFLYRAMMLEYSKHVPHSSGDFAAYTKMNNAKCVLIEPSLTQGGEAGYAHRLFLEVQERRNSNNDAD